MCISNDNITRWDCCTGFLHRAADLTLVPSAAIAEELEKARVTAGKDMAFYYSSPFM